jgi:hypothetical protein
MARRTLPVVCVFTALLAMVSGQSRAQPIGLQITFNPAGCPLRVSASELSVPRGKQINWIAVDEAGSAIRERFRLYFDPLQGAMLRGGNGSITRPIDSRAPLADYKYTVVGDRCPEQPLDPMIRVVR